jgi:hypothetical protein
MRTLDVLAAVALLWIALVPLLWVDYQAERDRQREARLRELRQARLHQLVDQSHEPASGLGRRAG